MPVSRLLLLPIVAAALSAAPIRFVVIGDYGVDNANQAAVAAQVAAQNPQFIVTVGDNNYFSGSTADWDRTQGQYYSNFIQYPVGSASAYASNGVTTNNFFPTLGNHDWDAGVASYSNYFNLPTSPSGGERYYTFSRGPADFFILDSDPREPDGNTNASTQAAWLQSVMAASTAEYKFVFFHHPAYTSPSDHNASTNMRWDFEQWGATAVFQGHNHFYERMLVGNLTYLTIGSSGNTLYPFNGTEPTSQFRNNTDFGFLLIELDTDYVNYRFVNAAGNTLDNFGTPEPGTALLLLCAAPLLYAARNRRTGKR